jgi:hypothetical protein
MGWTMHHYLHSKIAPDLSLRIKSGTAKEFTTLDEIEEVIRYIRDEAACRRFFDKVIFLCEPWRFSRTALLANTVIQANHDAMRCWWIDTFESGERGLLLLYRHAYEFASRMKNRKVLAKRYSPTA